MNSTFQTDNTESSTVTTEMVACSKCGQAYYPVEYHICDSVDLLGYNILSFPQYKSELHIPPDFVMMSQRPKPNAWHRFWYRVLLGWTWSDK